MPMKPLAPPLLKLKLAIHGKSKFTTTNTLLVTIQTIFKTFIQVSNPS